MTSSMRNLIEYHGISGCCYAEVEYFKQMNTDFTMVIPTQKPDIEQIVRVWVKPQIIKQEVIETPRGVSHEGQILTGHKLMVLGMTEYKVEYVALDLTQTVHTAHIQVPFCGYVVLPEHACLEGSIRASVVAEDMYSKQIDRRSIYNNMTMLIIVDLC